MSLETEVAILKKDVDDLKEINRRLDSAIERLLMFHNHYTQSWQYTKRNLQGNKTT